MFIELQRGRSFGGLTRYCLGPGEAGVEDRVEFVETRNIATRDPEAAWRVMAARHYMQDDLKAANGIRRGSNGKPVGHMFISWGAEEAANQNLDHNAMMQAANGALEAIGAEKHQAIVIAHNDTQDNNPHCHVIINLIGEDGCLKDNKNEKKKLSRFALEHETLVHGEPVVRTRYRNWQDRDAGETPAPVRKKARHLYEIEKATQAGDISPDDAKRLLAKQREIEQDKQRTKERFEDHEGRLKEYRDERISRIEKETKTRVTRIRTETRKEYREYWTQLDDHQFWERGEFNDNEKSLRGSLENAMRLVDWKCEEQGATKLTAMFNFANLVVSEKARREEMTKRQQWEREEFRRQQRQVEAEKIAAARTEQKDRIAETKRWCLENVERMEQRQIANRDRLKKRQQAITKERNDALKHFRVSERIRKRERAEERQYIAAMTREAKREPDDVNEDEQKDSGSGRTRRPRRKRDPATSRRKRQQRGETEQQYQERMAANQNRQDQKKEHDQEPER